MTLYEQLLEDQHSAYEQSIGCAFPVEANTAGSVMHWPLQATNLGTGPPRGETLLIRTRFVGAWDRTTPLLRESRQGIVYRPYALPRVTRDACRYVVRVAH